MSESPLFKHHKNVKTATIYSFTEAINLLQKTFKAFPWGYRHDFCKKNDINYNTLNGILNYNTSNPKKKGKLSSNKVVEIFKALGYDCEKSVDISFQISEQKP